jgi:hypothetical protein
MPAEHIAFFFAAVTRAGLKAFHPDVFGPTHSTYNLQPHVMVTHPYLQSVSDRPVPGLTQYFCPGPPTCSETPYSDFQPGLTTGQCQKTISPAYGPAYREPNVGQLVDSAVILGLHWVTHVISSMFSLRSKGGRGGAESVMWNHDEHVRRR